jgi:hypothetical protein
MWYGIKMSLVICAALFAFISCKKKDLTGTQNPAGLPKLIKILDTIVNSQMENRTIYYYAPNGNCDSIVYQDQNSGPNPTWSYSRARFGYNNDSLPLRVFMKIGNTPEYILHVIGYSNTQKIKKLINFSDTIKFMYDLSDRLARDSQFDVSGNWIHTHVYAYDSRNNVSSVINLHFYPAGSTNSETYTYDTAINPLHQLWNYQRAASSISPNNMTSLVLSGNPVPRYIWTYQYNSHLLPVKSYLYQNGQPNPYHIYTYFYK